MFKIESYISPTTIEFENTREPNRFTRDELLNWTFGVRISFTDNESGQSLLLLPDASLFQVLHGLATVTGQLLAGNKDAATNILDREGGYNLWIKITGDAVEVSELFSAQRFVTDSKDFIDATALFLPMAIDHAKKAFPKLEYNKDFLGIESEIMNRLGLR